MTEIKQFKAESCFSYLLTAGNEAIIIDPHLSLFDNYLKDLNGLNLVAVIDTHTHADYVSCAGLLCMSKKAPLLLGENANSDLTFTGLLDGDSISFGGNELKVLATPGHTDDSISLVLDGYVFTGDSLLINSIGRCDFQNGSAIMMYASLQKLKKLPAETIIYPCHDYNNLLKSSIGEELANNRFMQLRTEEDFTKQVNEIKISKPADMDNIIALNQSGKAGKIEKLSANKVAKLIADDGWLLLDVRSVAECASMGIERAVNIPMPELEARINEVPRDKNIILTCKSGARAMRMGTMLTAKGYGNLYLLDGAILAWKKAGLPVKRTGPLLPIQQQIQLVAGIIVTSGILGSHFIHPLFILLSLMAGLGLTLAGVTGTCLMGNILQKAPWNKSPKLVGKGDSGAGCSIPTGNDRGCSL